MAGDNGYYFETEEVNKPVQKEAVSKVYFAKNGQNIIWICALYVPFFMFSCDKTNHRLRIIGLT
jgi:hypothetical protein